MAVTYTEITTRVNAGSDDSASRFSYNINSGENGFGRWDNAGVHSAFRFNGITIPANAIIIKSYLIFTAQYSRSDNIAITLKVEDTKTPSTYGATEDFSSRSYSAITVDGSFTANWTANTSYNSSDIRTLIQYLVSTYGAYSSGSMAFMIQGTDGSGYAYQSTYPYEVDSSKALQLYIKYWCPEGDIVSQISASADDSSYYGAYNNADVQLLFGDYGGIETKNGFRFTGITIPDGATIDSAYIYFIAEFSRTAQTANMRIYGENDGAPSSYGATEDFSSRDLTTAYVAYTPESSWSVGDVYMSPDIGSIITELMASYSYNSGAIALQVNSTSTTANNFQVAYAYDGSSLFAAQLVINYTVAGWANIAKINGIAAGDIAKINGIAVADIAKINGVAV